MKPFRCVDCSENRKNTYRWGDEFLVARPSAVYQQELNRARRTVQTFEKRAKLPMGLRVVRALLGYTALATIAGILSADVTLAQGYANAPAIHWISVVALMLFVSLAIWAVVRRKRVQRMEEYRMALSRQERLEASCLAELDVPKSAKKVDILTFCYKLRKEMPKIYTPGVQMTNCKNPEYFLFADEENFYLANENGKYAFPLAAIRGIRTFKRTVSFPQWHKTEPFQHESYSDYNIMQYRITQELCAYYTKPNHILALECNGETWGIYFPCYELPTFRGLTEKQF